MLGSVCLGGVCLGSAGCTGPRVAGSVSLSPAAAPAPARGIAGADSAAAHWRTVLAEHTRRVEPYNWAIRTADMRATLVTPRLRKAFFDARSEFQGKFSEQTALDLVALGNPDEGVDAPTRSGPDAEQQVLVFVAMYVADQVNRDLAAGYTIWQTRLVRGAASVAPIKIETLRMSPAVADVFPFVDRYDDLYLMRFPLVDAQGNSFLSPGGEPLRLEVKSALADAVVQWTLTE